MPSCAPEGHPSFTANGSQRIVDKVRTDLIYQQIETGFAKFHLLMQ